MTEEGTIESTLRKKQKRHNPFSRRNVGKSMHSMLDGTFLTGQRFIRALPFILFLMFLGILYITNIFHVERMKRQLDDLDEQLRELRYEYISTRSKLMFESKPSEISGKLRETGIKESVTPPEKISVTLKNTSTTDEGH